MSDGAPDDMWTPYKYLQGVIESSLTHAGKAGISTLEVVLQKHKQNFTSLLRNPPKNPKSRTDIRQGITEGVSLPGLGHTRLSKDLVDESLILSDMYDMNEYIALELLCTAQQQMPHHPGLPRGLVAVLLYYDGRKALACALRDLFQARSGISWCTEAPTDITQYITAYTDRLVEESNVLNRIIDLLAEMDITKELDKLSTNRALGPPKHHRQVLDLYDDIRLALATALFNWSAQCGLPKNVLVKLIDYLAKYKPTESRGGIDDVTVTLLMALIYGFDASVLQRHEDGEDVVRKLPILREPDYTQTIFEVLDNDWECGELKSVALFGFALALSTLRQAPQNLQANSAYIIDKDSELANKAIELKIFDFIHYFLLENEIIFKTEFFFRRIHNLFTDFIELMHSKVTELRARADETARIVQSHLQQGLEQPINLCRSFESLMLAIGKFYKNDHLGLCLCLEYWGPMEIPSNYTKTTTRSVALFKFIRLAGELLPSILFVPYLKMLSGLSSCEQSARNTFNLLKQGSGMSGSTTLSWNHFFESIARYYGNLRQEQHPVSETIYKTNRSISPQEIAGLQAVLGIIRTVATHDEVARVALCEHPSWAPLHILLGLLSCSVPLVLKADVILTLSALAKSRETAFQLWNNLEVSQIITTIPTTNTYTVRGLETEIEQIESRNETYPLSQAVLELLYTLCSTGVPKNLGGGPRRPGLDPYLTFVIDTIFLRFYNRNYKNASEKWEVGQKCLKLIEFFVNAYDVNPSDFVPIKEENSPPGFHIMLQMNTKSDTLRLLLYIIDEACANLDTYAPFIGKAKLEECALHSLNIIQKSLECQDLFFDAHSVANSSILLSGLNKLLFAVNPRSGKPDHILNTTKFVTYNSWLPAHALSSVKILTNIIRLPNINSQLLGMFTQSDKIQNAIRHGFVECLEGDLPTLSNDNLGDTENVELGIKEAIINLLQESLPQPAPNLAHYLLGFDITKDIRTTQLQQPGILDFPSNCTKSMVSLLDKNLEAISTDGLADAIQERLVNRAYELLYTMCFNQRTSEVILRFLRSCNDFLCRHISALPFKNYESAEVLGIMSSLLKCVAIELKITAAKNQMSQFTHLCRILLGVVQNTMQENIPLELSHFYSNASGTNITLSDLTMNKKSLDQNARILICHLLECMEFEVKSLSHPKWDFFDNSLTAQLLKECEIKDGSGSNLISIKKLQEILKDELNTVQSTIAAGQRQLIMQEIETVLMFAMRINAQKYKCAATIKFMEAWGQVTEVLFSVAPPEAMPAETKQELILDILQTLLSKVVPAQTMQDLANLSSSSVLLLLVNLRYCINQKPITQANLDNQHQTLMRHGMMGSAFTSSSDMNAFSPKSNTLILKYILKNIVEWIIVSGVASQKLRMNLYSSLLNFMHIVKGNSSKSDSHLLDEHFVSRLDKSMTKNSSFSEITDDLNQTHMTVEVFTSFGDKLIDILCHDCTGGHDICKMLALSCIDMLLEIDPLTNFINFISNRGYLSHLIDSLMKSDNGLCRILESVPENLRALYVYESKMAMLSRIGSSYNGAELLLEQRALGVLSGMKVFDLHPDFQVSSFAVPGNSQSFVPPIDARYQQILFPALNLCDVVMSTLGPENHSAITQVVHFLLSHGDMVEIVLRAGTPFLPLGLLKELSAITGLIARTANQDLSNMIEPVTTQELGAHLYRLQKLMLALFPRFILSEVTLKQILDNKSITYELTEQNKADHVQYFLEIASNLSLYCRNAIANHSVDHRSTAILFSPSVSDSIQRNDIRGGTLEITPSLGIVVSQLRSCVEHFSREKLVYENLLRQRSSLSNINLDINAQYQFMNFTERLSKKQTELKHCRLITEQCLYLLWAHLDFYMLRAIPVNTFQSRDSYISSPTEAGWRGTTDDLSALKKALISLFNETFCKQLVSTTQSQAAADKGFTEALLRRVKRLIQFVPVN